MRSSEPVPPRVARRIAHRVDGAAGFRYGELPADVAEALPRWLAEGCVEEGEEIKPQRVYRFGEWAVKFHPPRKGLRALAGPSPAVRSADLHAALLPIRTPRPLVALERKGERGVLVSEFVEGRYLHRLWLDDLEARRAFPTFMAAMHRQGVFHGDLNVRNVLWNGAEWVLIDLDGVRLGPTAILTRRRIEDQWARVVAPLRGADGVRELYGAYLGAAGHTWDWEASWARVAKAAESHAARWDAKRGGPPAEPPWTR